MHLLDDRQRGVVEISQRIVKIAFGAVVLDQA
jgi:hypothetical protein